MEREKYATGISWSRADRKNKLPCAITLRCGEFAYRLRWDWAQFPAEALGCQVSGVCCDRAGNVYAACRKAGLPPVLVFGRDGRFLRALGQDTPVGRAHGIYVTQAGDVWLCDDGLHVARRFGQDGVCKQTLGLPGIGSDSGVDTHIAHTYLTYLTVRRLAGPFNKPTRLVEGPGGRLYATDGYGNAALHIFTPQGELIRSVGGPGMGPGEFNIPHSLWADPLGRIWVADRDNDRVQLFDKEGKLLQIIPNMLYTADVWARGDFVYVAELDGRVSIFNLDCKIVAQIGHFGSRYMIHSFCGDHQDNLFWGLFGDYPLAKLERL